MAELVEGLRANVDDLPVMLAAAEPWRVGYKAIASRRQQPSPRPGAAVCWRVRTLGNGANSRGPPGNAHYCGTRKFRRNSAKTVGPKFTGE